jgi:serine protease Do
MTFLIACAVLVNGNHFVCAQQKDQPSFVDQAISDSQPKMVKVFGASAGKVEGFATGIIVSKDGMILSSQGVFLDGRQVKVVLADGVEHFATILKRDRETQLSLLKIQADTPSFFKLSEESIGKKGDWVIALSNAFKVADKDEPVSAMLGVISLRTTIEARLTKRDVAYRGELVLIDAITSNPGASGGAVVTPHGELVGIVGKIINSSETNTRLNYAVPNSVLYKFLAGKASVPSKSQPATEQQEVEFGVILFKLGGRNNPAYVDRIVRGSPAAKAKLKSDDMIVSIAGKKIGNLKDYAESLKSLRPEEEVLMMVKRGVEIVRVRIAPRLKK